MAGFCCGIAVGAVTRRCIVCGAPNCDHITIRYRLRAAMQHYLIQKARG
jgi:hypothetical protein